MSRDEEAARRVAELDALDRILAREPIAEEHLELAALVDSVRAGAPSIDPAFAATLEERFAGRPPRHVFRPRVGQLAIAGGGLVAAAAALTILLSGSVRHDLFGGGKPPVRIYPRDLIAPNTPAAGAQHTSTPAQRSPTVYGGAANSSATAAAPLATVAPAHGHLVQRGSALTLSAPASSMQSVANRVVAATEQLGGVVESSNVSIHGHSSYASFSLRVASGRLGRLIAALSSLANVAALNQSTQDITSPYNREVALLAQRIARRASLRKQLAVAVSTTQAASLRKQIARLNARIAIEQATITRLQRDAASATLGVQLIVGAASKRSSHSGALATAYHDALNALQEILAIALVVLAILLPLALCGLAVWWAATTVRQRARERAIRAA